jgi:hypothetical protein
MGKRRVKIDLVDVISQAAPQVWGSDERELLNRWLARNTEARQMVEVNIRIEKAGGPGPGDGEVDNAAL